MRFPRVLVVSARTFFCGVPAAAGISSTPEAVVALLRAGVEGACRETGCFVSILQKAMLQERRDVIQARHRDCQDLQKVRN